MPEIDLDKYYSPIDDDSIAVSIKNASFSFYYDHDGKENSEDVISTPGSLNIQSNGQFTEQKEFLLRDINLSIKKVI